MSIRIIALIVSIILLLLGIIPVWADIQEYREVDFVDGLGMPVNKPTAQFSVTHKGTIYKSPEDDEINSNMQYFKANVGDTVTVIDLSHSNRGKTLKAWDFQYTRPDGKNQFITTQAFQKSYTLDVVGIYTFSLCVRDTIENEAWTSYWGNWSDNGNHRVIGINPGRDASDPADDFNGYWYFTRIVVEVVNNPPTADFAIEYKGVNVTDNQGSPVAIDETNKALVLKDNSKPFSATEPITGRKWYYWNTARGWVEIAGSENETTVNISDMGTSLLGSAINKAFKLVCISSTGGQDNAEHTGYFKKGIPAKYGYIVYYKDVDTELDIKSPKMVTVDNTGTYTEYALSPTPTNGMLLTASPADIVLTETEPQAEFTFYYKFTVPPEPPANNPPTAILETPEKVMAGQSVKANGGGSWSNNPGGYIEEYYFEYDGASLVEDKSSYIRIWYPAIGTFPVNLTVTDENGDTDSMSNEIKVIPPIPMAVITVTGKLKENRKVTISSSGSASPTYYPIDSTKTTWTITPISGGTASDIKYSGSLAGYESKDVLFKKFGTYIITLKVTNTYGLSDTTTQTITIAQDLPPVAKLYLPTPTGSIYKVYRDPANTNYATFEIFNQSYSTDGDTINRSVMMYCYDSDNDGDYKDEQWYYSKDGTTWASTGMNYTNTVSSFNIYNIATSNVSYFTLKTKEVGRFHYAIRVMETIPTAETIPAFITESDYKRDDDF